MEHFLFLLLFMSIGTFAWGALLSAPWVPTLSAQRSLLLDHLTLPHEKATIYDLGCGSGSLLFAFADRYPHARCIGYDVALFPLLIGIIIKILHPKKYRNVHLRFGNFFTKDVHDADIVVAFLMQKAYPNFFRYLQTQITPSTMIILEAWPYPEYSPTQIITGEHLVPWYVYTKITR